MVKRNQAVGSRLRERRLEPQTELLLQAVLCGGELHPQWEEPLMPYTKSPRPYKREYQLQKARGEHENRMERQRARRELDKKGKDANGNGKADVREGKDVAHKKALDKGGSNKHGVYVTTAAKNRSFKRDSKGNLVSEVSKRERKK